MVAGTLLLVEPDERRTALARSWGADAIDPREAGTRAGRFDVAIEAAGVAGTAALAVRLARRGGRVVIAGIAGGPDTIGVDEIVTNRLEIKTVFGAPRPAWEAAVDAFSAGILDPGGLLLPRP